MPRLDVQSINTPGINNGGFLLVTHVKLGRGGEGKKPANQVAKLAFVGMLLGSECYRGGIYPRLLGMYKKRFL
jgi:hypothetical protein